MVSGALIGNEPHTLMSPEKAEELVMILNEEAGKYDDHDDEWTYVAVHDPKGTSKSYINVYDSTNELLGHL